MAEAFVEERHLLKSLRWWDGFVIALCNPGFLIASLGFSIGALGTWGAVALWGISAAVGMMQTWIYAESASMFPDKPGGISLYAHEGWRGRFSLAGPIGAFGYWIGWSVVLAIFGKTIGDLVTAKWFPNSTWSFFDGAVHLGLPHFIAIGCIIAVWLLNVFGIRPAVWVSYVTGAGLLVTLIIFIFVPYFTGNWHSSNMTWALHGWLGWKTAFVWLFLMGWSIYAAEICATFAPEYHNTRRDTTIALRSAGVFTLMVALLFPLGVGGVTGVPATATQEGEFYVPALTKLVGSGAAGVVIVLLIGSLFLSMISSTADGSRALYGIARDDMTVKQLYHLNRFHVPARAMTVDLVVNVLLVLFISSNLAILYMSNIGYVLAHVLALSGFLLLRRDRPNWPRPIKVGPIWVGIAAVLVVYNVILIGFGVTNPALTGYGTFADMWIGVGVLVGSVLLFFFRRLVQDKAKVTFREEVPTEPTPEQMALLREEAAVPVD
ncbi:MAG TPA: APC family permease [Streptosporangiaceae bacterium]